MTGNPSCDRGLVKLDKVVHTRTAKAEVTLLCGLTCLHLHATSHTDAFQAGKPAVSYPALRDLARRPMTCLGAAARFTCRRKPLRRGNRRHLPHFSAQATKPPLCSSHQIKVILAIPNEELRSLHQCWSTPGSTHVLPDSQPRSAPTFLIQYLLFLDVHT